MPYQDLLLPRRVCLMVIDPQERLMAVIDKAERVIRNICLMVECARVLKIPVLASTQYEKGLGPFVPEISKVIADAPVLDKVEFNAFANDGVRDWFAGLPASVDTVILTGVEAHICVHQTMMGALSQGFYPWVVSDAVSSRDSRHAKAAIARFHALDVAVGPAEMAVYELLGRAGTPEFKALLPHLR